MTNRKTMVRSKSLWFNGLTAASVGAAMLIDNGGSIPPELLKWSVIAVAVLNIVLRFATDSGLVVYRRDERGRYRNLE